MHASQRSPLRRLDVHAQLFINLQCNAAWPLQFALILLRAPRQALQCGLHEAAELCAQRYDGDEVRLPAADDEKPF